VGLSGRFRSTKGPSRSFRCFAVGDTGCLNRYEKAYARHRHEHASLFSHRFDPRSFTSRRKWVVARRSSVWKRTVDQRNRHQLVPASSGTFGPHSRTRIEGSLGCARVSCFGCRSRRATPRPQEAHSAGNGVRARRSNVFRLETDGQGKGGDSRRVRWPSRRAGGSPSRTLEGALRGRGFSFDGSHSGLMLPCIPFTRTYGALASATSFRRLERASAPACGEERRE